MLNGNRVLNTDESILDRSGIAGRIIKSLLRDGTKSNKALTTKKEAKMHEKAKSLRRRKGTCVRRKEEEATGRMRLNTELKISILLPRRQQYTQEDVSQTTVVS